MDLAVTKVPSIPDVTEDNLVEAVTAIKNVLIVREGALGNPLDRGATLRDLVDLNLVTTSSDGSTGNNSTGGGSGISINPVLPPPVDNYNPSTDYTIPPQPTGLRADGGFTNVYLSWDGAPYKNHAYTEIWRSDRNVLGNAVMIGTTAANVYADPADSNRTYYYWIRFVSKAGVKGPYNGTAGVMATTAIDVAAVLPNLVDDVLNSQLVVDLGARIISTENGISSLQQTTSDLVSNMQTLTNTVGNNTASIQVQARVANGLSAQYTVKIDNNGHVSGFGLASSAANGTVRSAFIVRADRFAIVGPNDSSDPLGTTSPTNVPFVVLTTPQTIGGITYPAGAWMKTAFIADATITSAKIQSLVADKITTGSLTAAVGITTGNISGGVNTLYTPGSVNFGTGFYLGNYGGTYEFFVGSPTQYMLWNGSNLSVTGNINATSGSFRNITIYDSSNRVILDSGGLNLTYSTINASQVSGLGTIATQNNVNWSQLVSIPAFGNFAFLNSITSANISTYIASAAIGTAYIANAAITSALIADASVNTAKIADASITNAKIQDLAVDTLKIQGNAVTVPVSAYTYSPGSIGVYSYTDLVSVYINRAQGLYSSVPMAGIISYTHANTGPPPSSGGDHTVVVRVVRTADGAQVFWAAFSALGYWTTPYSASFKDDYIGPTSYVMQAYIDSGSATAYYCAITLIETKR